MHYITLRVTERDRSQSPEYKTAILERKMYSNSSNHWLSDMFLWVSPANIYWEGTVLRAEAIKKNKTWSLLPKSSLSSGRDRSTHNFNIMVVNDETEVWPGCMKAERSFTQSKDK